MLYREDPKTKNMLSSLGFGCMRFPMQGAKYDLIKTEELIMNAYHNGVNYFDTAYIYLNSEEILGKIIKKNKIRKSIYLATKLPHGKCKDSEDIEKIFQTQLNRLCTDYIDYYLIHNIRSFEQWERLVTLGIVEWISNKKNEGSIINIGFSFHGPYEDFVKLIDCYDFDFVQIQYNYMNEYYQAGTAGLKLANEKGLAVIVMEPLLGGSLVNSLPNNAMKVIEEVGSNPVELALSWIFDHEEVTVVLSGMNKVDQLQQNIMIASNTRPNSLSNEAKTAINKIVNIFNDSYKVRCTGCNYCMPCPKKINIPSLFAAYNTSYAINWQTGLLQYIINTGITSKDAHLASDCINCGKCVKQCPQAINIPQELKSVKRRLQLPGMKLLSNIISRRD